MQVAALQVGGAGADGARLKPVNIKNVIMEEADHWVVQDESGGWGLTLNPIP